MNNVDPSGKAFVNMGALKDGGGDVGVGCTEDEYLSTDCGFRVPSATGALGPWLDRCGTDLAIFGLTTVAGLLGVYLPEGVVAYAIPDALVTIDSLVGDVSALSSALAVSYYQHASNIGDIAGSIIQLLWDGGVELVRAIFKALGRNLFASIAAGLSLGSDLIPGVIEAKLVLWGIGSVIGAANLAADNCLLPP